MTIREARRAKKMTQSQLAEAIEVNPTVISRYESGTISPPLHKLYRIAAVLGVSPSELISDTPETVSPGVYRINILSETSRKVLFLFSHHMESIGYKFEIGNEEDIRHPGRYAFDCTVVVDEKRWGIVFFIAPSLAQSVINYFLEAIASTAFVPTISKLSFASPFPCEEVVNMLPSSNCTDRISFDLSVLQLDFKADRIVSEYELATHYDGSGLFDLSIPGKEATSARNLAKWKASLSSIK